MDTPRIIGREAAKGFRRREHSGFWRRYGGGRLLDIGYRGDVAGAQPILPQGIGIELGDPGYDGLRLPFDDLAFDTVHSSHVLEHVHDPVRSLKEWWRVVALGGHLITIVPHAYLYERRQTVPPSRWSPEHFRAFTPGLLLTLVEIALTPNTYRVMHLRDVDDGYRYDLPITQHPQGGFEIELVIQRMTPPRWQVEP
jgi:SAM-dependent methyltransferase